MKIKPKDEYAYLSRQSIPYALGWHACAENKDALSARIEINLKEERLEFDRGYGDCYANGEKEPTEFNYEEGI